MLKTGIWVQKKSWIIIKIEIENIEKLLRLNETWIVSKKFQQEKARQRILIHSKLGFELEPYFLSVEIDIGTEWYKCLEVGNETINF